MSGKMSTTFAFLVSTTLIATIVAASFDSLQSPFSLSSTSERSNVIRSVPGKRAVSSSTSSTPSETPVRLCGMRLLDAVRTICGGYFTGLTGYNRRSDPAMSPVSYSNLMMNDRESYPNDNSGEFLQTPVQTGDDSFDDSETDNLLWSRSPKAMALRLLTEGKVHHRYRRDIIRDCCYRPCAVSSLVKYCGRPPIPA